MIPESVRRFEARVSLDSLRHGQSEFVAYVEDGDLVVPGAAEKCVQALDENPWAIGVTTNEEIPRGGGHTIRKPRVIDGYAVANIHNLTVWRRCMVGPYLEDLPKCPDSTEHLIVLRTLADGHVYVHLDEVGYVWRNYHQRSPRGNPPCEKYPGEMADLQQRARASR